MSNNTNIKTINLKIDSIYKYIKIFNGIFNLTKVEIQILAEFAKLYHNTGKSVYNIFDYKYKVIVTDKLKKRKVEYLNNYIKSLKDKKAILPTKDGKRGSYYINPLLVSNGRTERIIINVN